MNKRLFTDREAADYLGVSRATIWNFMNDGKLASIKLGNHRRIEVNELDRFINDNAVAA